MKLWQMFKRWWDHGRHGEHEYLVTLVGAGKVIGEAHWGKSSSSAELSAMLTHQADEVRIIGVERMEAAE